MQITKSIWRRFIECECHSEGIMVSHEDTDPFPQIYLAFFKHGAFRNNKLSFKEKLRYCWIVLLTGHPFEDEIILRQETAKELADCLLEFANKKLMENK